MADASKRRTLKLFGATTLVALPVVSIGGLVELADPQSKKSPVTNSRGGDLSIQIVDTSSVPGNSVLIHNSGAEKAIISQFVVGTVVYNSRMLDLNALVTKAPIVIAPGQTKSFTTDIWNVLVTPAIEHAYADHAIEVLNNETRVIRLGVYMFDEKAVVYTEPVKTIYS